MTKDPNAQNRWKAEDKLAYTLGEAASLLNVSYHTLYRSVKTGDIRTIKGMASMRISKKELERFVETRGEYRMQARWRKKATKGVKA